MRVTKLQKYKKKQTLLIFSPYKYTQISLKHSQKKKTCKFRLLCARRLLSFAIIEFRYIAARIVGIRANWKSYLFRSNAIFTCELFAAYQLQHSLYISVLFCLIISLILSLFKRLFLITSFCFPLASLYI